MTHSGLAGLAEQEVLGWTLNTQDVMIAEGCTGTSSSHSDCSDSNRAHWSRSDTLRFPCVTVLSDLQIHTCRPQTDTSTGSARRPRLTPCRHFTGETSALTLRVGGISCPRLLGEVRWSNIITCLRSAAVLNRLHLFGA